MLQFSIRTLLILPVVLAISYFGYDRLMLQHAQVRLPITSQVKNFQGTFYEPVVYLCKTPRMLSLLKIESEKHLAQSHSRTRVVPTTTDILDNPKDYISKYYLLWNLDSEERKHHTQVLIDRQITDNDVDQQLASALALHLLDQREGTQYLIDHADQLPPTYWDWIAKHWIQKNSNDINQHHHPDELELQGLFCEWLSQATFEYYQFRYYAQNGYSEAVTAFENFAVQTQDNTPSWKIDEISTLIGSHSSLDSILEVAKQTPFRVGTLLSVAWNRFESISDKNKIALVAHDRAYQSDDFIDEITLRVAYQTPQPEWLNEMRENAIRLEIAGQSAVDGLKQLNDPQLNDLLFQRLESLLDKKTPWLMNLQDEFEHYLPEIQSAQDHDRLRRLWWRLLREGNVRSDLFIETKRNLQLLGETDEDEMNRYQPKEMRTASLFQNSVASEYSKWLVDQRLLQKADAQIVMNQMTIVTDLQRFTTEAAKKSSAMAWAPVEDAGASMDQLFWSVLTQIDFSWTVNDVQLLSTGIPRATTGGTQFNKDVIILQLDGVHYAIRNDNGVLFDYANVVDVLNTIMEHRKDSRRLYMTDGTDGEDWAQIVMLLLPDQVDQLKTKFGIRLHETSSRDVDLDQYPIAIP